MSPEARRIHREATIIHYMMTGELNPGHSSIGRAVQMQIDREAMEQFQMMQALASFSSEYRQ